MPRASKTVLTHEQLEECKRLYEDTPLVLEQMAKRYGTVISHIHNLSKRHSWTRYRPPLDPIALERDIEEAVAYAENEALARTLREAMQDTWKLPPPPVDEKPSAKRKRRRAAVVGKFLKKVTVNEGGDPPPPANVVPLFPGWVPAPKEPEITIDLFDVRSKADQAKIRIELGELRGALSTQQFQRLQSTRKIVDAFEHYFAVYLRPQDFLEQGELGAEAYQERLNQLRVAALRVLCPTERDTLAQAMKTLVSARDTVTTLERTIIGAGAGAQASGKGMLAPDGTPMGARDAEISAMGVDELRQVKDAMQLLVGQRQAASEPPKPPEPESLLTLLETPHEPR